ncbi:hypothetical protein ANCCAN_28769 [Ancylostoma caninum]|uniref:SCP domain-containing protein n=1 Tax=Ancylostoma caninum TaxID=29170 RepID=A0A368F1J2_ANCCA|nr:hypothetical protein ANCCAN_28769 [Ancylostoma caninum]
MIFSQAVRSRRTGIVTKFTKMAWWNNVDLGCAVRNCNSFYFTSCMYGPGGNDVGSNIYTIGAVCSGCSVGCVDGLCPAP